MSLERYGWNDFFAASFAPYARQGYAAGRVFLQHNKIYMLYTEEGEMPSEVSGRVLYEAATREELPAVGDWVAIRVRREERKTKATIHAVLPRCSKFSRKVAGSKTDEQVVAANIDTLFLVTGLDNDFNVRRIERYLLMASESGARAVVVLNKADVAQDAAEKRLEVERIALDVPVVLMSAQQGEGIEALLPYVGAGQTVSLMGSSGVGKSTITNKLLGKDTQKVQEVRAGDERGKHTTTHRELIILPTGGLIIDTPGMRELQLLVRDRGLRDTFEDIQALGQQCYFRDCKHEGEPDCAVRAALESGELNAERYDNYRKMQQEMAELAARQKHRSSNAEQNAAVAERDKMKKINQALKKHYKNRQKD